MRAICRYVAVRAIDDVSLPIQSNYCLNNVVVNRVRAQIDQAEGKLGSWDAGKLGGPCRNQRSFGTASTPINAPPSPAGTNAQVISLLTVSGKTFSEIPLID